ncbi:SRPBCC domain-containing protein [Mycolicibacterium sp. 050158]|uniref:SRPBCC domain-containing protein n=1 Tax=Mycolicibacterium sp. 050158 TaxID=3090602 RepID=UPI00299F0433|nr:SRPBCC domain-containing protein [Mycolicibacterium sp. 050158]MDX1893141.1 SRPBCC domain-containing protein [Mycolicibacterium sp. 050158]
MSDLSIPDYDPTTLVRSITVEIAAPGKVVWDVLTDLDRYPQWNPFCLSATSTLEMGAPVAMVLADYTGAGGTFLNTEFVCAFVPERLLSWELRATPESPYAARRDQVIEPSADGSCRYYSTDAFLGEFAHDIMAETGDWVRRAFDDTALALKRRSEVVHAGLTASPATPDQ